MDDERSGVRSSGLLSRLHRVYGPRRKAYEKEDLFTEYLAWLRNRSDRFRVAFARLALDGSASANPEAFREAEAQPQVDTRGWGQIDLVLDVDAVPGGAAGGESPGIAARLAIECKVDESLGEEQLRRYHKWLEEEADQCGYVAMAALTKKQLGEATLLAREEHPFWQSRMYWHKVGDALDRCIGEVRKHRLPAIDPDEDEFLAPAGFVVIGDELGDLMREEGMLAATKIDAGVVAERYREFNRYKSQLDEILSLVANAIDAGRIEPLLEEKANANHLRRKHKKPLSKGRPVSVIYHRNDPPAAFMFGVSVSPPNRYARRPGKTFDADEYEAELIAGYKLLDGSGDALQMQEGLDEIAKTLTVAIHDRRGPDIEVFVPESAIYQNFVARTPVPDAESADEQAREMGHFYQTFVSAFIESEAANGRPMLEHLRDLQLEVLEQYRNDPSRTGG